MTDDQNKIFDFFLKGGNGHGHHVTPQLSAPASLTPSVISATEIDLVWTGVTNATNYVLERGTMSDYSDAVEIYSGALASFNDTGLTGGTLYYYRVKAHAAGFLDSDYTNASATTSVASTTSNLTFTTNTNLVNTAQVFTSPGGGTGLDVINVANGGAARIYYQYKADSQLAICGFSSTNAQISYTDMKNAFYVLAGGALQNIQNGNLFDPGYTMSVNEWVGILCIGGVMKLQVSPDAITWTDILTFRGYYYFNYPIQLYIVSFFGAGGKMYNPKVDIYGAGTFAKLFIQDGNSLGYGYTTGGQQSPVSIGQEVFFDLDAANNYQLAIPATPGQTTQGNLLALPTAVYPLFANAYSKIIVAEIEGTNQMAGGSTPAQAYAYMMQYVNAVLNQDPRTCVMVYTMISIDPALVTDANKNAYNALLLATPQTSRFKIVDTTGTPALNDANAYLNPIYYLPDGIHLTSTVAGGYILLGNLGKAVALTF